jgi:hypothetical protein
VVVAFRKDASDDAALIGDPQAAFGAESFDIDGLMHGRSTATEERPRPI